MPKHSLCSLKLMAYYDFKGEIEKGGLHPKVEAVQNYLRKNIPEDKLEDFYDKIISHCKWFPGISEINQIYNSVTTIDNEYKKDLPTLLQITHEHIADDIPMEIEGARDVSFKDMYTDEKKNNVSEKQMLQKYGFKKCTEYWHELGARMTDDEYSIMITQRKVRETNYYNLPR